MRVHLLAGLTVAAAVAASGCSGGGSSSSGGGSPSSPSSPAPSTINIVASAGNQAYSPNPIQVAAGTSVVWKNSTPDTHHIIMDIGTEVGNLAPGASSAAMSGLSGNY